MRGAPRPPPAACGIRGCSPSSSACSSSGACADRPVWGTTLVIVGLVVVVLDRALPSATTGWEAQEKRRCR